MDKRDGSCAIELRSVHSYMIAFERRVVDNQESAIWLYWRPNNWMKIEGVFELSCMFITVTAQTHFIEGSFRTDDNLSTGSSREIS